MKKLEKKILSKLKNENLDRFAGSSDEEDEEKPMAPPAPLAAVPHNQDDDDDGSDAEKVIGDVDDDGYYHSDDDGSVENDNEENDDDLSSVEGDELDPASKMASAMGRILGTENRGKNESNSRTSSVVLAKTVTPLQKLQHKEKNEQKAMKEKRKANRERNLTALHLPLSIATTNSIESGGKLSVAKELEQERFHRRVATRGVVALFNAITQHQKNHTVDKNDSNKSSKKKEALKLTKHGFLDKIKAAAKTKEGDKQEEGGSSTPTETKGTSRNSWGALKDDYMLGSKKNWDEESSDEEPIAESEMFEKGDVESSKSRKKRRISRNQ